MFPTTVGHLMQPDQADAARHIVSLVLAILGAVFSVWILKVGIFLTGSCLGLATVVCLRQLLEVLHVVTLTHSSVALVYVCAATGFGVGALYFERPIIIAVSATAGSFLFCAGAKQWRGRQLEKLSRADDTTFEKLVE
eukprot:m.145149 g.145149  ORF g.145149 m.145149 type:complete len:138 (+) comp14137_c0_seq16:587-1000(+)